MNVDKIRFFHIGKETMQPEPTKIRTYPIHTYVAYNPRTGLTKIGRTGNEVSRIQYHNHIHGTRLKLIALFPVDIEAQLHTKYQDQAKGHEWFNLSDAQLSMLRRLSKNYLLPQGCVNHAIFENPKTAGHSNFSARNI